MTAPAATEQQPQQQPTQPPAAPPDPGQPMADAAIVAGLAALLASTAAVPPLAGIVALLIRPPARRDEPQVPRAVAIVVAKLVLGQAGNPVDPIGAAGRRMQRTNLLRRAQFLLAAARRVTRRHRAGGGTKETLVEALQAEQRFWRQHVEASAKRTRAAAVVDSAAEQHGIPARRGTVLGWAAVGDDRTTAECRAAHGKNWLVERPPRIGIPGTVHVHCRCRPVAPWPTKQLVGGGQLPETPRR